MKEKFLRELADIQTGPFGSQLHKEDYVADGTPIVTVEHLGNKMFSEQNLPRVSNTDKNRLKKYVLKQGDIVFSRVGSVDRCSYVDQKHDGWMFSGRCLRVRPTSEIDSEYLYYYFCLEETKQFVRNIAVGATMPSINTKLLGEVVVTFPELEQQKRISGILSAIDSKIEVNQKINDNLQQQAQALFKSWFLNYEPWDGTAPNSWLHGKLGDYANIKRGGSPRPIQEYLSDSGLRWLKISDVTGLQTPFIIDIKDHIIEEGLKKTVFLKAGSLVLSNSATPGIPKILDVDSCIHDGWLYFPESRFSNEYLYLYFKYIRQQLVNLSNGSVFNNLKTDILKGYPTILPDEETLQRFDGIIKPMFLQMQNLTRESHDLMDLRDTILPRLMSGELDVSGI
ncbi:restriction endonuclease subunit S [Faecalibacterium prausnitzii]|uniref:restriction endonuclease subunit S n=1 Tax=Faecalibacterium prausnitzii TaxID=853 RepID=UPI00290E46FB|nr:restriction endonuclease subunit S [Faecalibacterium prausnitzii]